MNHTINHTLLTLFTFSTFLFTTGCSVTPKYHVTVDAIIAPSISVKPNSSYIIEALEKDSNKNTLAFQKFSTKLIKMLADKRFVQADENYLAKQTIYFDYGLEKVNEETETYSEPNISFNMGWGFPYAGYYGNHYHPFYNGFYGGGYSTYRKTRTYYNRYITLLAKDQANKELWRVDVSSVGESKNLRIIIPLLIEAATPYIGTNTAEPVQLVIKDEVK